MINLLATGLLSLCLLSPVQSPGCIGDVGVSTPFISVHVSPPPTSLLPVPLPPVPVLPHVPVVPPITPPVLPEPPHIPGHPHPPVPVVPPEVDEPAQTPEPAVPAPADTGQSEVADPATPAPVESPNPLPVFTPPAVEETADPTPTPTPTPVAAVPEPPKAPTHHRLPFEDGSFGAAIGNAAFRFPDLLGVFTIIIGLAIVALVERLDESPKLQSVLKKKK